MNKTYDDETPRNELIRIIDAQADELAQLRGRVDELESERDELRSAVVNVMELQHAAYNDWDAHCASLERIRELGHARVELDRVLNLTKFMDAPDLQPAPEKEAADATS